MLVVPILATVLFGNVQAEVNERTMLLGEVPETSLEDYQIGSVEFTHNEFMCSMRCIRQLDRKGPTCLTSAFNVTSNQCFMTNLPEYQHRTLTGEPSNGSLLTMGDGNRTQYRTKYFGGVKNQGGALTVIELLVGSGMDSAPPGMEDTGTMTIAVDFAGIQIDDTILMCGGSITGTPNWNVCHKYTPESGWEANYATLPEGWADGFMVQIGTNLMIFGGALLGDDGSDKVAIMDITNGINTNWAYGDVMHEGKRRHCVAAINDHSALIVGGNVGTNPGPYNNVVLYDLNAASGSRSVTKPTMNEDRQYPSCAAVMLQGVQVVVVAGGAADKQAEYYDITGEIWTSFGVVLGNIGQIPSKVIGNEWHVFGGQIWILDLDDSTWNLTTVGGLSSKTILYQYEI